MAVASAVLLGFVISLVISAIIIYVVTKLFGESEGFGTAFLAALIGALIYGVTFFLVGNGMIASLVGGIAWLIALGSLYKIGWLRALLIAVIIWVLSSFVSYVFPTVAGPL
ncbi:MAG TPA: hypothetical protein VK158_00015 [Acidobacteriota bacterium]|nr:hypothetical protein [Acidobacteriota bacterium]